MPWLRIIIQVASVLLCCAFVYDIFWVFVSPLIFHESVMIAVSFNINFASPFFPPSREKKRNHANFCFFFLPANKITLIILLSLLKHTSFYTRHEKGKKKWLRWFEIGSSAYFVILFYLLITALRVRNWI